MKNNYLDREYGVFEVRGAAGAGKTFQLVEDIKTLYNKNKRVIIISFSNAAVDELRSRLLRLNFQILTIHSFCWHSISRVVRRIISNDHIRSLFIPDAFLNSTKVPFDEIMEIKYGDLGIPQYKSNTRELWLSHNDVLRLFVIALKEIPEFATLIFSAMDFILIDEYQDTDGEFLHCLFSQVSQKIAIGIYGDPFQSIYLKKNSLQIKTIRDEFNIQSHFLEKNYRSQKKLVHFFNSVRQPFDGIVQVSTLDEERPPVVFYADFAMDEHIKDTICSMMEFTRAVTLSLTNVMRADAAGYGKIVRKIYAAVDKKYRDWSEIFNPNPTNGFFKILVLYANLFNENGYTSAQSALKLFTAYSISRVGLENIRSRIQSMILEKCSNVTKFFEIGLELVPQLSSIQQLLDKFDFSEYQQMNDFFQSLKEINERNMTIFAAKGLEFDNVILNIDSGQFYTRNWNNIDFEHSENEPQKIGKDIMSYLFYVGITRAQHGLAIFINKKAHSKFFQSFQTKFTDLKFVDLNFFEKSK